MCIVFLEGVHTAFDPECIKSNFLHTFVVVQVDVETDPHFYKVSYENSDFCVVLVLHQEKTNAN